MVKGMVKPLHDLTIAALRSLSRDRPIFHSECDFQIELGWQIKRLDPNVRIRAEVPLGVKDKYGKNPKLDLVLHSEANEHGIELKLHKGKMPPVTINGELFTYPDGNPKDVSKHGFMRDIARLESFVSDSPKRTGTAIILTNDKLIGMAGRPFSSDEAFSLTEGRRIPSFMDWTAQTSKLTRDTYQPVCVNGCYHLRWCDYNDTFQFLAVEVVGPEI